MQAVTFDVGGTLIEPWPSVGHVYAEIAAAFGIGSPSPATLNREFGFAWSARGQFDYSRAAWQRLVQATFTAAGAEAPGRDCFEAIYEAFGRAARWRVFDDVRETLATLGDQGRKLGVISNWDERLEPLLAQLKLADAFDVIVVSHQARHAKPAKEIFELAALRLETSFERILHVGDSHSEDVLGARGCGMQAVRIDRTHATKEEAGVISNLKLISAMVADDL